MAFSTEAERPSFINQGLIRATSENKERAKEWIEELDAGGTTNFLAAFESVQSAFVASNLSEKSSNCHKAVLFLTDGVMNSDISEWELYDLIGDIRSDYDPIIFTYSLGTNADTTILKNIACQNNGLWASIPDGKDLARYMSSYYKLFASGLSDAANENFLSWVEPYAYATGGTMGTTVSVPGETLQNYEERSDELAALSNPIFTFVAAFDNSGAAPRFIGVVGVDFTVEAMESAAGSSYAEVLERLVSKSTAK